MAVHAPTARRRGADAAPSSSHSDVTAALDALRRIVRALGVSSRTAERSVGLTGAQLLVLQMLHDAPAHSLNELAQRTYTHQSTVSVVVERLVSRGLVTRTRSEDDARRVLLALTPSGRSMLRRAPPPAQVLLIRAVHALTPQDRRGLRRALERLVRGMGQSEAPAPMFFEDGALSGRRTGRGGRADGRSVRRSAGRSRGPTPRRGHRTARTWLRFFSYCHETRQRCIDSVTSLITTAYG
jgi:MarR family transcriptional regulator, lower aerobic nicotinate degradation pathway regulator